ncbi:MAG: hypothetical protein HYU51_11750 [Candidatus Rokubacteria bacterium]|nr:hypothetical protein [Candidatus Rokubacteria bacterium]
MGFAALAIFVVFFAASTVFGGVLVTSTRPFAQKVGAGMFIGALMNASALALWRSTQPLTEEDISLVSAGIQKALDTPSNKPFHLPPALAPCGRSVRRR